MTPRRFAVIAKRFPLELPTPPGEDCFAAPARMMAEAGHNVEILSQRYDQQPAVEQIGPLLVRRYLTPWTLLAAIMCRKNDLVHSHSHYPPALFTGLFSWRARTIFTSHSGELPSTRWKRRVLVALMNRFDRIIALTTHERDMYLAAGVDPTRIVVISDAINVEFFSQPGDAFRFRQRWKLPAEVPVLLFVANIRKFKNPEVVLRAFRRVREREPRAVLAIAGKDLLPRQGFIPVTTLAEQAGVTEGLVLTGWLPAEDLRDAYAAADVVVNSSATTQESFSISTWEAIAAGRAVCLPHLGTFLATVGDAALYHEPSDDAGLAENILRYLREPDLRAKHVAVTRQLARQFAAPQVLRQLHSLYDSLLEG